MNKVGKVIQDICNAADLPAFLMVVVDDELRCSRVLEKIFGVNFKDHETLDTAIIKDKEWHEIEAKLLNVSLFQEPKIIHLKNGHKLTKKNIERLLKLVDNLAPGTNLILSANKIKKDNLLRKKAQKLKALIELAGFKSNELFKWTKNELARNGIVKTPDSIVTAIIQRGDESPSQIASICEHCSLFSDSESLTEDDFQALFPEESELKDYGLLDLIQNRKKTEAKLLCTRLIRQGRSPFLLLAMISRNYQQYAKFIGLKSAGCSDDEVSNQLKVQPWLFKKIQTNVRGFTSYRLQRAFRAIFEADLRLKDKSLGDEAIMGELVDRLCV